VVRFPAGSGDSYIHLLFQAGSGAYPSSHLLGTVYSFLEGQRGLGVESTTHVHRMLSLRMSGAVPTLLHMPSFLVQKGHNFQSDFQEIERGYILIGPDFESRQRQEIFIFPKMSRPPLGPTQPRIQLLPGLKRPGREVDYPPPCTA
jgi:hypothetical protein